MAKQGASRERKCAHYLKNRIQSTSLGIRTSPRYTLNPSATVVCCSLTKPRNLPKYCIELVKHLVFYDNLPKLFVQKTRNLGNNCTNIFITSRVSFLFIFTACTVNLTMVPSRYSIEQMHSALEKHHCRYSYICQHMAVLYECMVIFLQEKDQSARRSKERKAHISFCMPYAYSTY